MAVDDKKSRTPDASPPAATDTRETAGRFRRRLPAADATRTELQSALAELQVHQHELELQNEELRRIQESLDAARARYQDLFEAAPVGYLTLSEDGLIQEMNLTAAALLDRPRAYLEGRPFFSCVDPDHSALYQEHFSRHRQGLGARSLELRLIKGDSQRFWARLIIRRAQDTDGRPDFRVMLSDISELHNAEQAFRDTQLDLQRAQEMARIGVWRITDRGKVILCSDETYRILGIPKGAEVNQALLLAQVHPDERDWVAECRSRALRGEPYDIEHRLRVEGHTVWVREKAEPRAGDSRRRPDVFGTLQDISDIKAIEQSQRALQAELQLILDSLPAHIFYKDTQDRLLRVNRTVAEAWGLPKAQIEGHCLAEFFPERAAAFRQADAAVIASGEPLLGLEELIELPSGSARWLRTDLIPLKNTGEQVTGLLVMARDVTERKLTQQELQRHRDDLSRAQIVGRIGSWRLDGRTGALIWSEQTYRMFGIAPGTPMDYAGLLALLPPEDADRLDQAWLQALARRGCYVVEYRVEVDGRWHWLKETGELEFDADGEFVDAFGTVQDISDLKAAEEALRLEDRLKDEFLATLAHELRNPLAPLRNGIRVLKMAGGNADQRQKVLALMEPQLLHMVRLLDDLLDMSRIRQGRIELHSEVADLTQIVKGVADANRSLVEEAGHQLNLELPDRAVRVTGDPVRLAQVVANLLNNAVKYTPRGGHIDLQLALEQGEAVVRVRDSGIGIPRDMLERVFDLFTQVDQTYHRGTGGLGIGLNLAKRLVEKHGGRIEALSDGKGRGSEFVVTLPLAAGRQQTPETPPLPRAPAGDLRRHRVLVVDDNVSIVESLRLLLELLGQDVRCASSGEEALHQCPSFRPELVLLDIGMPGLSGYDTCRRMRRLPWGRGTTIVAMTGWAQERDVHNSRLAGFNRHLVKPVEPDILEQLLAALP